MRILIPTYLDDVHATAVAIALRRKGHEAVLWHAADYPTRQNASISITSEAGLSWDMSGPGLDIANEHFDVVWYRRPGLPVLPDDVLHPGDRYIAERACRAFNRAIWEVVAPDAFWVNPRINRFRATAKPFQLQQAVRAGLKVPPTLCSNDPDKIRGFLRAHEGQTIYKSFAPAQWKKADDEGIALMFTTDVTVDDLPDDEVLRLSSGIFQRKVEKDYELRLTYMGDFVVGAKLLSQEDEVSKVDWRAGFHDLKVEPAGPLPDHVDRACQQILRELGIVFGCFDLIVTPEGEYVFVEVNEMGQFLWVEEYAPEILMLDAFTEFLIHGRADFEWSPKADAVRFGELRDEAVRLQKEEDAVLHVPKPFFHSAADDASEGSRGRADTTQPIG